MTLGGGIECGKMENVVKCGAASSQDSAWGTHTTCAATGGVGEGMPHTIHTCPHLFKPTCIQALTSALCFSGGSALMPNVA